MPIPIPPPALRNNDQSSDHYRRQSGRFGTVASHHLATAIAVAGPDIFQCGETGWRTLTLWKSRGAMPRKILADKTREPAPQAPVEPTGDWEINPEGFRALPLQLRRLDDVRRLCRIALIGADSGRSIGPCCAILVGVGVGYWNRNRNGEKAAPVIRQTAGPGNGRGQTHYWTVAIMSGPVTRG
jgi:hypothetical protein